MILSVKEMLRNGQAASAAHCWRDSVRDLIDTPANPHRDQLKALALRVNRLRPDHRDPELFHLEKNDIAHELARLAGKVIP